MVGKEMEEICKMVRNGQMKTDESPDNSWVMIEMGVRNDQMKTHESPDNSWVVIEMGGVVRNGQMKTAESPDNGWVVIEMGGVGSCRQSDMCLKSEQLYLRWKVGG